MRIICGENIQLCTLISRAFAIDSNCVSDNLLSVFMLFMLNECWEWWVQDSLIEPHHVCLSGHISTYWFSVELPISNMFGCVAFFHEHDWNGSIPHLRLISKWYNAKGSLSLPLSLYLIEFHSHTASIPFYQLQWIDVICYVFIQQYSFVEGIQSEQISCVNAFNKRICWRFFSHPSFSLSLSLSFSLPHSIDSVFFIVAY